MSLPPSSSSLVESLEQCEDIIAWINENLDTITTNTNGEASPGTSTGLTELDQHITRLVTSLDIACQDTSSNLERSIDDVARGIPRLTYDLHFMKDGALSLQAVLSQVLLGSQRVVPEETTMALDRLQYLDTVKSRMEASRDVLREAESWSTLELEITSLLAERSHAKAAERLSEASKSMAVFQNTPDYDPRRTLLVNLQNQLEASLSTTLVSAINAQDITICREYFSIFCNIQRESEFRNYYNASRRSPIVTMWRTAHAEVNEQRADPLPFAKFLPDFFNRFLVLLESERASIPLIFPDPIWTLSIFISSTFTALQPTFSQRLSTLAAALGESSLGELLATFRATEAFAAGVNKVIEKMQSSGEPENRGNLDTSMPSRIASHRRRSSRMSISWRSNTPASLGVTATQSTPLDGLDWDQELFQPYLGFQGDYGALERRFLDHSLKEIINRETKERLAQPDRARLLRERAIDVFSIAEDSLARCSAFTHGYGAVGLVQALDGFFQSFIDIWTANIRTESSLSSQNSLSDDELSDLDYTSQDWSDFQLSLHLLSSARSIVERISNFETKLRISLVQMASQFRLARNDPTNFQQGVSHGADRLLEQSPLNSAALHSLLNSVENDSMPPRESPAIALRRDQTPTHSGVTKPLLVDARNAVSMFAKTCQISLQATILSPLRRHLISYASSPTWAEAGDPRSKHTTTNDLQVPTFSLSPSDTIQRVAEGLLNLPRLFEVYADDNALSFSLQTLPYLDDDIIKGIPEPSPSAENTTPPTHMRRASLAPVKPVTIDPELVSSAWLASLGQTLLEHLTSNILPGIHTLSPIGAAHLVSDLEYLSNIARALNVESGDLEKWKKYSEMDGDSGRRAIVEMEVVDPILQNVAKMRGWSS
ncbi:Golgi complex component 7-domain-containing protein [Infundibulicybe gibba]|nr:Golgi complex component 7-domain-containing protein [Infundibulicybe gibba]